jgi:hypothetical protein
MSLYKISIRGVLGKISVQISKRGLWARLLKRPLYEGYAQKISVWDLRSLSKIAALFTRSLYKISRRGLLARSL